HPARRRPAAGRVPGRPGDAGLEPVPHRRPVGPHLAVRAMSVLDDLAGIDLSAIVDARATLSASISADDLQHLLSDVGVGPAALGQLGAALDALRQAAEGHPEALVAPVLDAVAGLAGALGADHLPIGRYRDAVREGATLLGGLAA